MNATKTSLRLAMAVAAVLFVLPCAAHHSAALFDAQRSLTLQGTVQLFQWTNPHCFIQVLVPAPTPGAEWSVEMGSPSQLYRRGWRPATLKPGDKVTIVVHPTKDGTKGGEFVSGIGPDGTPFGAAAPRAGS